MPPSFYTTRYDDVCSRLSSLTSGAVSQIGTSAGGLSIPAVAYGEKETFERTTHRIAGHAGSSKGRYMPEDRKKPVLVIVSAMHGAEMESIAGAMNLISVLESGEDLKSKTWPGISDCADKLRIVVAPIANPDGRTCIPSDDQQEWDSELTNHYRHGTWKDGSPITHGGVRDFQPLPLDRVKLKGGYVNANGIEPTSGWKFGRELNPEAWAAIDLVEEEYADCVLDLHSCGAGPFLFTQMGPVPDVFHSRQSYIDGVMRTKFRERDLGPKPWTVSGVRDWGMYYLELLYQFTGCLPLCYEGPSGVQKGNSHTHEQIVDQYLTLFESVIEVGAHEGLRPEGTS